MLCATLALPARAEPLRVATWHVPLTRKGPGLLLRDLLRGADADLAAAISGIDALGADILLLTDIDFDLGLAALGALNDRLDAPYPHLFARAPNTGLPTGHDLDANGQLGEPRDAQGYGWYAGEGGMALLSRYPLSLHTDLTALLWKDLPDTLMRRDDPGYDIQRLSSSGHWIVKATLPGDRALALMAFHATPPVFDGPEDRNGRRNHDEILLWRHVLNGRVPNVPPGDLRAFVLLGNANLDPDRGQGLQSAMRALLADPRLQDPLPGQITAEWPDGPGALRVSYLLPSAGFDIVSSGVAGIGPDTGPHRPVWADLHLRHATGRDPPDS